MNLYLEITRDKYALPLLVCSSVDELARKTGLTKTNVASQISHGKKGEYKYPRFIKVVIEN